MSGKKISVYLRSDVLEFLKEKASRDGLSVSSIVGEALARYMEDDKIGVEMALQQLKEEREEVDRKEKALQQKAAEVMARERRIAEIKRLKQIQGVVQ